MHLFNFIDATIDLLFCSLNMIKFVSHQAPKGVNVFLQEFVMVSRGD